MSVCPIPILPETVEQTLPAQRNPRLPFTVSFVIPVCNSEDCVRTALDRAQSVLRNCDHDISEYEIIVVDDAGDDGTADIVERAADLNPRLRLIRHTTRNGYGSALRDGLREARYDLVVVADVGSPDDYSELGCLLPLTQWYGVVCCARMNRRDSYPGRMSAWAYNSLANMLLGTGVRDVNSPLKVFHRHELANIWPADEHVFANTELFANARLQGMGVLEVGIRDHSRTVGKNARSLRETAHTLTALPRYWWQRVLFPAVASPVDSSRIGFWPALLLIMVVAASLLFPNLSYPLIEPDEGRYAEIPREMLVTGDWLIPRFHGEPYLDKPPMFYWLCAGSYLIFGPSDGAARLVPACAAFGSIVCTFLFGRRLLGTSPALLSSLILTTSLGFVYCGRFLILDSLLTFFVVFALFAGHEALCGERVKWGWWVLSALACGCGLLTKGPVALVLSLPPMAAHLWLNQSRVRPGWAGWVSYVALAGCVALPWYAAIMLRDPQFAGYFFWEHNVQRFFSGSNHAQPMWYYLPVILLATMPWALLFFPMTIFLFSKSARLRGLRPRPLGYLMLWAVWCVVFFSLSRGKLAPYILPAFPALALLLGYFLHRIWIVPVLTPQFNVLSLTMLRRGTSALCVTGIIVSAGACLLQLETVPEGLWQVGIWSLSLAGMFVFRQRLSPKAIWAVFLLAAYVTAFESAQDLFPAWGQKHAIVPSTMLDEQLDEHRDIPLGCLGGDWGSVPFYLQRDDIHFFDSETMDDMAVFVTENPEVLLLLDRNVDLHALRTTLPAGVVYSEMTQTYRTVLLRCRFSAANSTLAMRETRLPMN